MQPTRPPRRHSQLSTSSNPPVYDASMVMAASAYAASSTPTSSPHSVFGSLPALATSHPAIFAPAMPLPMHSGSPRVDPLYSNLGSPPPQQQQQPPSPSASSFLLDSFGPTAAAAGVSTPGSATSTQYPPPLPYHHGNTQFSLASKHSGKAPSTSSGSGTEAPRPATQTTTLTPGLQPQPSLEAQRRDIETKIAKERRIMAGAQAILDQSQGMAAAFKDQCTLEIQTARQRIEYLERTQRELEALIQQEQDKVAADQKLGQDRAIGDDLLRPQAAISSERVRRRLKDIRIKLETEKRVQEGTERMMGALGASAARAIGELEARSRTTSTKIALLARAEKNAAALFYEPVGGPSDDDEPETDVRRRVSGRLFVRFIGFGKIAGISAQLPDAFAVVSVDGVARAATRPRPQRWDEQFEVPVDRATEVELALFACNAAQLDGHGGKEGSLDLTSQSSLMALSWFKLCDLEEHLQERFSGTPPADGEEITLQLEPGGELNLKAPSQVGLKKSSTQRDQVVRRVAVQRAYPKNGHRFFAMRDYRIIQSRCATCGESIANSGYQCANCGYVCHAGCYNDVITKCISLNDIRTVGDRSNPDA
ncbi:Serine/threonine kinase [Cladochytrium tenue]|nr:Serine/threonine kinase [Cladochytrium tenue]